MYSFNKKIDIQSVLKKIEGEFELINYNNQSFDNIAPINEANLNSLVFIGNSIKNKEKLINSTSSQIIILNSNDDICFTNYQNRVFVITNSPRTILSRIINFIISEERQFINHDYKNEFISPKAKIGKNVNIGIGSIIGNAIIGDGCKISNYAIIEDDCIIGDNVFIGDNTIIGSKGLSILGEQQSQCEGFPQLGGVLIEDNVHIDAFSTVQRGTFGFTYIRQNVKIDTYVQIAHNSEIGRNTTIIGHSKVSGGVKIGIDSFIGQSVTIADGLSIGSRVFICMGSVVVRDIIDGCKVSGNPAKAILSPLF
jgi:UDP-3-O-[3-hydroxymyristoyl] glucosamine N-acyltransferase